MLRDLLDTLQRKIDVFFYKESYIKFRQLFNSEGVPFSSVEKILDSLARSLPDYPRSPLPNLHIFRNGEILNISFSSILEVNKSFEDANPINHRYYVSHKHEYESLWMFEYGVKWYITYWDT